MTRPARENGPYDVVVFSVLGRPLPAGSKTAVPTKHGPRVVETGNRTAKAAWRADIREAAHRAMRDRPPLEGPLELYALFHLRRPVGHYGTGTNRHRVKPSSPPYPAVMPDLLKLTRGLEDAMQGIVYANDAQIVIERLAKAYGEPERVEVTVSPVGANTLAGMQHARRTA